MNDERLDQFKGGARGDILIWAALVGLGALSFAAAFVHLGAFGLVINLLLAAAQITLLGLFFMELRRARALIVLTSVAAFLFVAVLFALTLNDLFSRV
jgi:cytochrome c oxidase subunit IV